MITISTPRRHQGRNEENNPEAHRQDRHKPADQMTESPTRTGARREATDSMDNTVDPRYKEHGYNKSRHNKTIPLVPKPKVYLYFTVLQPGHN